MLRVAVSENYMSGTDNFEIDPVMMCLFTGPLPR